MIFNDQYEPKEKICCYVCGKKLIDWEGSGGPCSELTFYQFVAEPKLPSWWNEESTDGGSILDPSAINERLPNSFTIYSNSCGCPLGNTANCKSENGVWVSSSLYTGSELDRKLVGSETKKMYKERMKWLAKKA